MSAYGRPATDDEFLSLRRIQAQAFLSGMPDRASLGDPQAEEFRVLRRGRDVAGGLRIRPFGQWFGGRSVPMGGIASVAIEPAERGSGAASELMRAALDEMHEAGTPLSVLYPATIALYRAVGYEIAGHWIGYRLDSRDIDVSDRSAPIRRVSRSDREGLERCYTARAKRTAGHLQRTPGQWSYILDDPASVYATGDPHDPDGYVSYVQSPSEDGPNRLVCRDLVWLTPQAGRRLLTFLAAHRSQIGEIEWRGGPNDAGHYLLGSWSATIHDALGWMLRIVDVRGALSARGYAVDGELHLDVRDDCLPWNHGRFILEVSGGRANVRKGGRGRVRLDVRGLAALYTGHLAGRELVTLGLSDASPADLDAATHVFAGPAPWMPDYF